LMEQQKIGNYNGLLTVEFLTLIIPALRGSAGIGRQA
jgi:hypothetical protein